MATYYGTMNGRICTVIADADIPRIKRLLLGIIPGDWQADYRGFWDADGNIIDEDGLNGYEERLLASITEDMDDTIKGIIVFVTTNKSDHYIAYNVVPMVAKAFGFALECSPIIVQSIYLPMIIELYHVLATGRDISEGVEIDERDDYRL